MTTAAVLLCAGGSSRFGEPAKLLAGFRGKALVSWAVEAALAAGLDETVVVTGAVDLSGVLPDDLTILDNHAWRDGIARSLGIALDWCGRRGHSAAVVGLGDQPLVSATCWRAVAAADAPVAVATYGGRRRNPVRLDASVWSQLQLTGDEGARALMARHPELVADVACEGDPVDIDTAEELESWS